MAGFACRNAAFHCQAVYGWIILAAVQIQYRDGQAIQEAALQGQYLRETYEIFLMCTCS